MDLNLMRPNNCPLELTQAECIPIEMTVALVNICRHCFLHPWLISQIQWIKQLQDKDFTIRRVKAINFSSIHKLKRLMLKDKHCYSENKPTLVAILVSLEVKS